MNEEQVKRWFELYNLYTKNSMDKQNFHELVYLNHLVMELSHKVHNDNMLRTLK